MQISLIVATDEQGVIGKNNQLLWKLPAEMQHFRQTTAGKPVIMGRKTYESIGRPLPKRKNIILTRDQKFSAPGCEIVHTIEAAINAADNAEEIMIIGGTEIYNLFLPQAHRLYLTIVHANFEGDAYFPAIDKSHWQEISHHHHPIDADNPYAFTIFVLEKR